MTPGPWRKSSYSQASGNNCIQMRASFGSFQLRDSTLAEASPVLTVDHATFTAFLTSLKNAGDA